MKFRKILILWGVILISATSLAQRKQIGEARTYLKSGKNYDKAEKLMTDLLKDSVNQENKRIYEVWLQSVQKQYEQANEKFYMKKQQDTAQFFGLVRKMFSIAERLDSLDMKPDKKGNVDAELRAGNAKLMLQHRPNLFFGGAYFVRKLNFKQAYDYFETYIDCKRQPLFSDYDLESDLRLGEAAYWATYCGFRLGDALLALRYHQLALRDTVKAEHTLKFISEAWLQLKDDSMYVSTLNDGFERFPTSSYFFPRLMDYYSRRGNNENALKVAEKALEVNPEDTLFLYAKSSVLLNLGRYEESLRCSNQLIAINDSMPDAYLNAGMACLNMVLQKDPRKEKKEIRKLYQKALPYMEHYRLLAPSQTERWASGLYRIYLNLNMGKQFEEIDKILKK